MTNSTQPAAATATATKETGAGSLRFPKDVNNITKRGTTANSKDAEKALVSDSPTLNPNTYPAEAHDGDGDESPPMLSRHRSDTACETQHDPAEEPPSR